MKALEVGGAEGMAAQLLPRLLGGRVIWRDHPDAPPGTPDFDLKLPKSGQVAVELPKSGRVAVEVTRCLESDRKSQEAALEKCRTLPRSDGGRSWYLNLHRCAVVKDVGKQALGHVHQLENDQVVAFQLEERQEEGERTLRLELASGTSSRIPHSEKENWPSSIAAVCPRPYVGACCVAETPGRIYLGYAEHGSINDSQAVTRLLELIGDDNVPKLQCAEADERHLFVWVDDFQVQMGIRRFRPRNLTANELRRFFPAITRLWVATPSIFFKDEAVVWSFGRTPEGDYSWRADRPPRTFEETSTVIPVNLLIGP